MCFYLVYIDSDSPPARNFALEDFLSIWLLSHHSLTFHFSGLKWTGLQYCFLDTTFVRHW